MRVAIVEPFPRVSGVTIYAWHAAQGFRDAGCDVDIVTFTKSGKARAHTSDTVAPIHGWQWFWRPTTVTAPWRDAARLLDEYDFVLLNEAKCMPLDKQALRAMEGGDMKAARDRVRNGEMVFEELPLYAQAIADLKRAEWGTVLHAPQYQFQKAPMTGRLLLNAPPGVIVAHKPGAEDSARWALDGTEHRVIDYPYLPYVLRYPERTAWPNVVGITGRFITNKGQPTLAAVADRLPEGWDAEIWGAGPAGAGANHTFLTYEGLVTQLGWTGERAGQNASGDAIGNRGDVLRAWPWEVEKDGRVLSYRGGYTDEDEVYRRMGVYVNLTDPNFCGKGNEYTHLEAMDSGAVCAVPDHCFPSADQTDYDAVLIDPFTGPVPLGAVRGQNFSVDKPAQAATINSVELALNRAAAIAEDSAAAKVMAERNRAYVARLNSPKRLAEAVLQTVFPGVK